MRDIKYSGGLRLVESIVRTPAGRRVLRIEVHGPWTGVERGASGNVMGYFNAVSQQADFVLINLKDATACAEAAVVFPGQIREELQPLGGDAIVSEAPEAIAGALALQGAACAATDAEALAQLDRTRAASHDSATVVLPPAEGWARTVATGTCEFKESIVISPEGRRVMRVVPSGNCAGSDWIAGRAAREHLESLSEMTWFVLMDLADAPTWADAASAAAWVLRSRLKTKAGDCVLAGTNPLLKRSTIPFQWKISPDVTSALERIDKGE